MNDADCQSSAGCKAERFLDRYPPSAGGSVPKHVALGDALRAAITDGFWQPGEKLPAEVELAAASPFSLGTVQRALRGLVERGMVERHRSRGTFVPRRQGQVESPWHCRFMGDDGKTYLPVIAKVLARSITKHHGPWSVPLGQGDDDEAVQLDRLMEVNSEFNAYSKFYVLAHRFPEFLTVPLESLLGVNLKALVVDRTDRSLTAIREQIRQAVIPDRLCEAMGVPQGTVGLHVQATAYSGTSLPVYYQELYIPPTERRLCVESRVPPISR